MGRPSPRLRLRRRPRLCHDGPQGGGRHPGERDHPVLRGLEPARLGLHRHHPVSVEGGHASTRRSPALALRAAPMRPRPCVPPCLTLYEASA
eukprot:7365692-Heterocapsa_arctica.AAC.1